PAIAATASKMLVLWDFSDTMATANGVACRAFDTSGNAPGNQVSLSTELADVVTVTPLTDQNFAVTWNLQASPYVVHSVIAKPDCTALALPGVVSTNVGTSTGAHRAHVAANGSTVLYAWIVEVTGFFGGDVHIRTGTLTGLFNIPDTMLASHTADQE